MDERYIPFVFPLLHDKKGIYVDALLLQMDDVSSIFSYHRAYFLVDVDIVSETIDFLQTILPSKRLSELYNSIGFEKHGKTVFFREYLRNMLKTEDKFVVAPGIKGMVMTVFTLPSLNVVFKVIKDKFDPPKKMTEAEVREKYHLVNLHDRVGRMTDTHMFEYMKFDKSRFSNDLLTELKKVIPSKIKIERDVVTIDHLYVEKRMIPLNIYLEDANKKDGEAVIDEYGKAIKQLAAANIFPGDMLLKNFGVTRLKRVVFYDYDEIGFLTDYNFRYIPEPRDDYELMSSKPYFHVGLDDIFPEEFRKFLMRTGHIKTYFEKIHGDLFEAKFWNKIKNQLERGVIVDVFPYQESKRFKTKYKSRKKR
ncbi:MAG: bifunctional isocitrate dehydrogenase kinase/phosphatase [Bacteroidota bacterium]